MRGPAADLYPICSIVARRQAGRSYRAPTRDGQPPGRYRKRQEKAAELEIVALSYHL
jgi:hypothetical protein